MESKGVDQLKILVLPPDEDIQRLLLQSEDVDLCYIYRSNPSILDKCLRRIGWSFNVNRLAFSKDYQTKNLGTYDIIILDEVMYPYKIIEDIRRRNSKCKIIYWMWNTVGFGGRPKFYNRWQQWEHLLSMRRTHNFVIASFDESDCERYQLLHARQVAPYLRDLPLTQETKDSVYFFGRDKGRLPYIRRLYHVFSEIGIRCDFNIVPDSHVHYVDVDFDKVHKVTHRPYRELIQTEIGHRALLEIVQKGQNGVTWRALEAMFYNRKLITNCKCIKDYDFYSPDNIFILGEDDLQILPVFMQSKYAPVDGDIVRQYTFEGWLDSILEQEDPRPPAPGGGGASRGKYRCG